MPSDEVLGLSVSVRRANFDQQIEEMAAKELEFNARYTAYLNELLAFVRKKKEESGQQATLPTVSPGEFPGWEVGQALVPYMRQRKGIELTVTQVANDLLKAGVNPGKGRRGQKDPFVIAGQNIKIAVTNNPRMYDFRPKTDAAREGRSKFPRKTPNTEAIIWLAEGGEIPPKRKRND